MVWWGKLIQVVYNSQPNRSQINQGPVHRQYCCRFVVGFLPSWHMAENIPELGQYHTCALDTWCRQYILTKILEKIFFKLILVTDGCDFSTEIALRWTSLDLSDNSTLVQIMAWCRQATRHYLNQCWPRSLRLTRPQCVNSSILSATYMRQWIGSALVQIIACLLFSTKPLSKPMLCYFQLAPYFSEISIKIQNPLFS